MGLQFEEMLFLICTGPAITTGIITKDGVGGTVQSLLEYSEGKVFKEGLRQMQKERQLSRVLRKLSGIDPKDLERRVREAMNSDPPEYNAISSNCAHFALNLLGMDSVSSSFPAAHPHPNPEFPKKNT